MTKPEVNMLLNDVCDRLLTQLHDNAICACGYLKPADAVLTSINNVNNFMVAFNNDVLQILIDGGIIDGNVSQYFGKHPIVDPFGRLKVGPVTIDNKLRIVHIKTLGGKSHEFAFTGGRTDAPVCACA